MQVCSSNVCLEIAGTLTQWQSSLPSSLGINQPVSQLRRLRLRQEHLLLFFFLSVSGLARPDTSPSFVPFEYRTVLIFCLVGGCVAALYGSVCICPTFLPYSFTPIHISFTLLILQGRKSIGLARPLAHSKEEGRRTMRWEGEGGGGVVTRIGRGLWTSRVASDWLLQMGRP